MPDIYLYPGAANPHDIILRDPTQASSGTGVTGTLSATLDNAVLSGESDVAIAGILAKTLDNATLSGTASVTSTVTGTGAATLQDVVLSGSAVVTETEQGSGFIYAPEIFYRPKKVKENDEAIVMELLMLLDERW